MMSFETYQAAINEVTAGLGGARIRHAVAATFNMFLGFELTRHDQYGPNAYGSHGTGWTEATPEQFDKARVRALRSFSQTDGEPYAEAEWEGFKLLLVERQCVVIGGGFRMTVARFFDSRDGKFQVGLDDAGVRFLMGKDTTYTNGSKPQTTHTKSVESAHKAVRRMVEDFFKIKFTNIAEEAA